MLSSQAINGPVAQLNRATAFKLGAVGWETTCGILADQESLRNDFGSMIIVSSAFCGMQRLYARHLHSLKADMVKRQSRPQNYYMLLDIVV